MKIRFELEIELDENFMDESDPFAQNWLWNEVMAQSNLHLHSDEIGDFVGEIKSISKGIIVDESAS